MYFTTHMLVGAAAGLATGNAPLGAAVGLASHTLFDAYPHHDYHRLGWGLFDLATGLTLAVLVVLPHGASAMSGAIAASIPDLEVVLKKALPGWRLVSPSHTGLTPHFRLKFPWGFLTQVVVGIAALALL